MAASTRIPLLRTSVIAYCTYDAVEDDGELAKVFAEPFAVAKAAGFKVLVIITVSRSTPHSISHILPSS